MDKFADLKAFPYIMDNGGCHLVLLNKICIPGVLVLPDKYDILRLPLFAVNIYHIFRRST